MAAKDTKVNWNKVKTDNLPAKVQKLYDDWQAKDAVAKAARDLVVEEIRKAAQEQAPAGQIARVATRFGISVAYAPQEVWDAKYGKQSSSTGLDLFG